MKNPLKDYFTIKEAADKLGVSPTRISAAFYDRRISKKKCFVVSNRTLIPASYMKEVKKAVEYKRSAKKGVVR